MNKNKIYYQIVNLRNHGLTLEFIGKQYDLSRERIRQICNRYSNFVDKNYKIPNDIKNKFINGGQAFNFYYINDYFINESQLLKKYNISLSKKETLKKYANENKLSLLDVLNKLQNNEIKYKDLYKTNIIYKGKVYLNKQDLIKEYFPTENPTNVVHKITQKAKKENCTFEKALDNILNGKWTFYRKKSFVYKGKTYTKYKEVYDKYKPKRTYSSFLFLIFKNKRNGSSLNVSIDEALKDIKEYESIKFKYNGKVYTKKYELCFAIEPNYSVRTTSKKIRKAMKNKNLTYNQAVRYFIKYGHTYSKLNDFK